MAPGKRRGRSIRKRLILLLLFVLIPVLGIQAYFFYASFQARRASELQANLEIARAVGKTFDRFVKDVLHQELAIGLALTSYQKLSQADKDRILLRSHADTPEIWQLFWASPAGVVLSATGSPFIGMRVDDRDYFKQIVAGQDYVISDLLLSRTTEKPSFTISRGIRDGKGVLLGIIIAGILPDRLDEELGVKRFTGGGLALVDRKGMLVYRYPAIETTWEQRNWLKQYPQFEDVFKGKEVSAIVYAPFEGKRRLVGFTPISSIGWAATAGAREEEVVNPILLGILKSGALFLSVSIVGFLIALTLSRTISSPITALRNFALALGRGEERKEPPTHEIPEFQDLTEAFDSMAAKVREREMALRESEEKYRTTLASIGDAVIATDVSGRVTFMNRIAEELTGWRVSEVSLKPVGEVFNIVNEQSRQKVEDPVAKVLREGNIVGLANHTILLRKDRTEVPIDDSGAPIRDSSGKTFGVVLVFRDITERKQAEEQVSRSHKTFSELIERAPFGIYVVDSQFRIAQMNTGSQTGAFRNVRPVIGRDFAEAMRILWPEPVAAEIIGHFRHTLESGEPYYSRDFINPRHDAETVEAYEWELHRMMLPDGQYGVICYYFDSTSLREAEAAVRASEERLRFALEACQIGAWDIDLEDRTAYRSLEHDRIFGYKELLPQWTLDNFLKHALPEYRAPVEAMVREATAAKTGWTYECRIRRVDGEVRWIWFSGQHRTDSSGRSRVAGVVQDITARKQAEKTTRELLAAVQQERDRLSALVNSISDEVWFADPEKKVTLVNPAVWKEFGSGVSDAKDVEKIAASFEVYRPDGTPRPVDEAPPLRSLRGETVTDQEEIVRTPATGQLRHRQVNATPVRDPDGAIIGSVSVVRDITARKRMEEELRRSRDELELRVQERTAELKRQAELIELSHDAILVRDLENRIVFWSKGAEEVYGWTKEEALGKITHQFLKTQFPVPLADLNAELLGKGRWEGELVHTCKEGRKVDILSRQALQRDKDGKPSAILEINIDITDRKRMEEQVRQAQRMEGLGTLAGGIAHDFNNLLNPILLNTELALLDMESHVPPSAESLRLVQEAANRGKELVKQIIVFSRHKGQALTPIEISSVINEALKLLKSTALKAIEIRTQMEAGNIVLADPIQIHQVIMNLCLNAAHAMRENDGVLEVTLAKVETYQDEAAARLMGLRRGAYVQLTVKDNGHGMSREILEKAFDPFFTTKQKGEGSGMGLAVVHGIVKKHEGAIRLESGDGKGTIVNIFLPVFQGEVKESVSSLPQEIPRGTERILFVDDEEAQVRSVQLMLERLGYRVTVEMDPRRALDLFRSRPDGFDLVITDQVMPHLPGNRLAQEMLGIRPDIPIILCTGFSEMVDEDKARGLGIRDFILKPFRLMEISGMIRKVLDETPSR